MKKTPLYILICFLLSAGSAFSQCYTQLDDVSGFDRSTSFYVVEQAACRLLDSLPPEFQDSFAIYGFGFYRLIDHYDDYSYDQIFEDVIEDKVTKPYYIIFGRESGKQGIYSNVHVRGAFPDCMTFQKESTKDWIINSLEEVVRNTLQPGTPEMWALAEKSGMDWFIKELLPARWYCCTGTNKIGCGGCDASPDEIYNIVSSMGFISIPIVINDPITTIDVNGNAPVIETANVKAYSEHSITDIDGNTVNFAAEIVANESNIDLDGGKVFIFNMLDFCDDDFYKGVSKLKQDTTGLIFFIWQSKITEPGLTLNDNQNKSGAAGVDGYLMASISTFEYLLLANENQFYSISSEKEKNYVEKEIFCDSIPEWVCEWFDETPYYHTNDDDFPDLYDQHGELRPTVLESNFIGAAIQLPKTIINSARIIQVLRGLAAAGQMAHCLEYSPEKRVFATYTMECPSLPYLGEIYVGRTSGRGVTGETAVQRRLKNHHHGIVKCPGVIKLPDRSAFTRIGYYAVRGREQQMIDYHGGALKDLEVRSLHAFPKCANIVRGVGKYNPMGPIYHELSSLLFPPEKYEYTGKVDLEKTYKEVGRRIKNLGIKYNF